MAETAKFNFTKAIVALVATGTTTMKKEALESSLKNNTIRYGKSLNWYSEKTAVEEVPAVLVLTPETLDTKEDSKGREYPVLKCSAEKAPKSHYSIGAGWIFSTKGNAPGELTLNIKKDAKGDVITEDASFEDNKGRAVKGYKVSYDLA